MTMTKNTMNLQDSFLNQVRKDNSEIKLVLVGGETLIGFVRGFDNFTVILNVHGAHHMIYKHAIAQIVTRRPVAQPSAQPVAQPGAAEEGRDGHGSDRPRERGVAERADRGDHGERPERQPRPPRPAPEAPKFNTIDLTQVKIENSE
jgi:host factor-I protein